MRCARILIRTVRLLTQLREAFLDCHIVPAPPHPWLSPLILLRRLNGEHLRGREDDTSLAARTASCDLAMRMQARMPEAVDLSHESDETKRLYGLDDHRLTFYFNGRHHRLTDNGGKLIREALV